MKDLTSLDSNLDANSLRRHAVLLRAHPLKSQNLHNALDDCSAMAKAGQIITTIFFLSEATFISADLATHENLTLEKMQHIDKLMYKWLEFSAEHQLELLFCVSSMQRRQLKLPDTIAAFQQNNFAAKLRIAGLGEWVEASLNADRLLMF